MTARIPRIAFWSENPLIAEAESAMPAFLVRSTGSSDCFSRKTASLFDRALSEFNILEFFPQITLVDVSAAITGKFSGQGKSA